MKSNIEPILWYIIGLFIILGLTILPSVSYNNSWNEPMMQLDSASKMPDSPQKQELLEIAGEKIIEQFNLHPYHARLQMMVGYYYFLKGDMDSCIINNEAALEKGKGGVVNSIEIPASELLANASINKSLKLLAKGDTISALNLHLRAFQHSKENLTLNKNLGWFYLNKNMADSALFHYRIALRRNKNDVEAALGLARAFYKTGNKDSIRVYTAFALKKQPQNKDALWLFNYSNGN
ncbi:hypothetical protein MASR1M45_04350 [Candidatus Kapaibacterium sp.]